MDMYISCCHTRLQYEWPNIARTIPLEPDIISDITLIMAISRFIIFFTIYALHAIPQAEIGKERNNTLETFTKQGWLKKFAINGAQKNKII